MSKSVEAMPEGATDVFTSSTSVINKAPIDAVVPSTTSTKETETDEVRFVIPCEYSPLCVYF